VERALDNFDFIQSLIEFVEPLVLPGRINSLAQTLIKLVAPGVPDFYQGTELWDLSLVDPDNRRPVDYDERTRLLAQCRSLNAAEAIAQWDSGLPKLWLIDRVLSLRAARPEQFAEDSRYQPLAAQGAHLGNLFAFRRGENLIAVVPRLTLSIANQWEDTRLPLPGAYLAKRLHAAGTVLIGERRGAVQRLSGGAAAEAHRLTGALFCYRLWM
jgi:(1->4)-alpha-D-glucan 1-alpha-D-glucosylmutase